MNEMESANRKMVETMTSTERCGPRLCKNSKQIGDSCTADHRWFWAKISGRGTAHSFKISVGSDRKTNPEEGAQWQPHLYILHFLQPEVWDLRLLGFACRSQMAEELGEEQSLGEGEHDHASCEMKAQKPLVSSLKRQPAGGSASLGCLLRVPQNCH